MDFKSHLRKNFFLAYPVMLSQLGQVMVGVADSMMVGRLGKEPLAAASFANSIFIVFLVFGIGISFAITPQTAQADGEKDTSKLVQILKHGIGINTIFGILLCSFILINIRGIYYLNQPDPVVNLAGPYLSVIGLSLVPFMIFQAFRQFVEGLGYTKQAMFITIGANIINVIFNYILIYGKLGFPQLGLLGAGISTLFSRVLMALAIAGMVYVDRRFIRFRSGFRPGDYTVPLIKHFLKLGLPMAFQLIFEVTTFSLAAIMMGWLGSTQLAAHQIAINLASVSYMVALGISAAATIRVGNQLGQKDFGTMREAAFTSMFMGAIFMAFTAFLFIVGRHTLPYLYINDPSVRDLASSLLIVAGLFQLSDGFQAIGLGILRGMSDVKVPTLITLVAYWVLGLPLGYFMAFHLDFGALGIWYGLLIGLTSAAILLFVRFNVVSKRRLLQLQQFMPSVKTA